MAAWATHPNGLTLEPCPALPACRPQRTRDLLSQQEIVWINVGVQAGLALGLTLALEPGEWRRVGALRWVGGPCGSGEEGSAGPSLMFPT